MTKGDWCFFPCGFSFSSFFCLFALCLWQHFGSNWFHASVNDLFSLSGLMYLGVWEFMSSVLPTRAICGNLGGALTSALYKMVHFNSIGKNRIIPLHFSSSLRVALLDFDQNIPLNSVLRLLFFKYPGIYPWKVLPNSAFLGIDQWWVLLKNSECVLRIQFWKSSHIQHWSTDFT